MATAGGWRARLLSAGLSAALALTCGQAVAVTLPPDSAWPFVAGTASDAQPAKPEAGGIGTVLEVRGQDVVVRELVPGGPAAKAGLLPGDVFVEADGWPVPPGAKVADVAQHVRGAPGQVCQLKIRRGTAVLPIAVPRMAMSRLFPEPSKTLLTVADGLAYLASGNQHTMGVRFAGDARPGQMVRYRWLMADDGKPLTDGLQGDGVVQIDAAGATALAVGDWKLELRVSPKGQVYLSGSNLPVHPVVGDWLAVALPLPSVVKPKLAPAKAASRWEGPAKLRLLATAAGKPLADYRVAVKLANEQGQVLDSRTVYSGKDGVIELPVPEGKYRVVSLAPAVAGRGRDLWVGWQAAATEALMQTDAPPSPLALTAKPRSAAPQAVDWSQDPRVGQGLPKIAVQRWFGAETFPKNLKGKVLLIDFWATWCGPCRATAPLVTELHSRLASKGLLTVAVSVDRDEEALANWAADLLPGAPPVAWAGPEAMELLDIESIPTFFVVDGEGRIRGFHKGGGWDIDAVELWLTQLLQAQATPKKK